MTLHEQLENPTQTPEALLQTRIDDRLGPLAQATAIIGFNLRLHPHEASRMFLDIAEYASDTRDAEPIACCFNALPVLDQWSIFEREQAQGKAVLPIGLVACLGEARAEFAQHDTETTNAITEIRQRIEQAKPQAHTDDPEHKKDSLGDIQQQYEASLNGEGERRDNSVLALQLAILAKSQEGYRAITEAESSIEGFYAMIKGLTEPPFDLQEEQDRQSVWKEAVLEVLSNIKAMPFSSLRTRRLLKIASVEQRLLHLSRTDTEEAPTLLSDELLCATWKVIARAFTDRTLEETRPEGYTHPEWLRDLWDDFKKAGLTFKKLRSQDPGYRHPRFTSEAQIG